MDYILNRINNNIEISDEGTYEYITSLRKRIEYSLFVLVGYLWNKNADDLLPVDRQRIITSFNKMSIGDVVAAIATLDLNKEVLQAKKSRAIINKYPNLRNKKIGHGYAESEELTQSLIDFYDELYNSIQFLQDTYSIVVVEKKETDKFSGIRIDCNSFGQPSRWACPVELFPEEDSFPRTYVFVGSQYYKLSPFVTVIRNRVEISEYIFSSLNDSLLGQIKLCPLFGDVDDKQFVYPEFARFSEEDEYREVSVNGTVMNRFDCNYSSYQDVGFTRVVIDFLRNNRANVSATLWGHGGVGKTACIQNVCQQLFCEREPTFSYIVFITAKDRVYNPASGKIVSNNSKYVRKYSEIIETIIQTVFPDLSFNFDSEELAIAEEYIQKYSGKLLIVIDDYETFLDSEKQKIVDFIKSLDINHHKVVITTRNIRLAIGTEIPTSELDENATSQFLEGIVEEKCPELLSNLKKELTRKGIKAKIYQATNGRPIFICQFAYLFMQRGLSEDIFDPLFSSDDAKDFLYGRVYDYLTENAKLVFSIIPSITNEDLLFRFDMLNYVLQKELSDEDKIEEAIEELAGQLIIERYSDNQGRIYAHELLLAMQNHFVKLSESKKDANRRLIESLGGKEVSGTIEEAMLREADQSRITGNTMEIIGKYRRVLNLKKCDESIRKQALINASSYLNTSELNPKAASELITEYWSNFKDDEQVAYLYVVYLWQQEDCKGQTVNFFKDFFSRAKGHKKTSPKYLQLFALGTSYCTYYDTVVRKYDSAEKKHVQISQTINEFGKELFEAVKPKFCSLRSGVRHVVQMGLIQTARACTLFGVEDPSKVQLGLEICDFALKNFNQYSIKQARIIRDKLQKMQSVDAVLGDRGKTIWWQEFASSRFKEGDIIEGRISKIRPIGMFIAFGKKETFVGLSKRSGQDIYEGGDVSTAQIMLNKRVIAKIIRIDRDRRLIDLEIKKIILQ